MQDFFDHVTVLQVSTWILGLLGALAVIDKGIEIVSKWHKRGPDGKQDEKIATLDARVGKLEQSLAKHDSFFTADKSRLDAIEDGNRVMQEGMIALLSHAIDGNDVAACKKAKEDLNAYLINRK